MLRRMLGAVDPGNFGAAAIVGLSGAASCGTSGPLSTIDCTTTKAKPYSQLTIIAKCTNCHSSTRTVYAVDPSDATLPDPNSPLNKQVGGRHGATPGFDYDTYALTVSVADQAADDIADGGALFKHLMPPSDNPEWVDDSGSLPTVTAADKQDFYAWDQCGKPQ